jgi:hypothetical protein
MTQFEVLLSLSLAGYAKGQWGMPKGQTYSAISVDFVRECLPAWLDSLPDELLQVRAVGGGKTGRFVRAEPEAGDCNIIATDFTSFLSRCMWRDAIKNRTARGNVAAGMFFFHLIPVEPTSGHAIVWFIDHEQAVHHVDPASKEIDHLTPAQLGTIFGGEYA